MSSTRWQRTESLFGQALELPAPERDAFLRQAVAGDSAVLNEVRELLSLYEADREFLETQAAPAQLSAGERLGEYRIESVLGEGGMGVVYRARHLDSGAVVAIKAMRDQALASPGLRRRFDREYRALASLDHPNIVRVHGLERDQRDNHFLVMELVEGSPLSDSLSNTPLPLGTALDYAGQIAEALSAAHAAGLVHRDVKPQNVIVTPERTVKVLDFGLCKWNREELGPGLTCTYAGLLLGTAPYMSPEQAQGLPVDQRSDVFSFGAVLYELLSGRPAFAASNPVATLAAVLHEEPPETPGIPEDVEKVIRRCLHKNPADRYPSGQELAESIRDLRVRHQLGKLHLRAGKRRRLIWRSAAAAALLGASALLTWRVASRASDSTAGSYRVVSLTSGAGKPAQYPAFSPDGERIVFSLREGSNFDIFVQRIATGERIRLTADPAQDRFPAWSPDGSQIAFLRSTLKEAAFYLVPASGGPERKLASAAAELHLSLAHAVGWFPDGKRLAVTDRLSPDEPVRIYALSIDNGEKRALTTPAREQVDVNPALSPDGRLLAFSRKKNPGGGDLFVAPSIGGEPRRLTFDEKATAGVAWSADGRSIVFSSNRSGTMYSLWSVAVSGGTPERLAAGEEAYYPAVSRSGNRLAYARTILSGSLTRVALDGRSKPEHLISSSRFDIAGQYSPDGRRIVFISTRTGSVEIWLAGADGRNERQLTTGGASFLSAPRWSPDGEWIAFGACFSGNCDVYTISSQGGAPRRLTRDASEEMTPFWSENGEWIYLTSNRTNGWQISRIPSDGGGPMTAITRNGGYAPQQSGPYLYFTKGPNTAGLWRVPAGGGEETLVLESLAPGSWRYFSVIGGHVYFIDQASLKRFEIASGRITRLVDLEKSPPKSHLGVAFHEGLSISPDRKWAVYPLTGPDISDILMVENFR